MGDYLVGGTGLRCFIPDEPCDLICVRDFGGASTASDIYIWGDMSIYPPWVAGQTSKITNNSIERYWRCKRLQMG
jgi:hypothetical protein